jgi:hypothetical protein
MKCGSQSGGTITGGLTICTNWKSGYCLVLSARATGPPRSSSQYHRPNTITLVSQMSAPVISRRLGVVPVDPVVIPMASLASDHPLDRLSRTANVSASHRSALDSLLMRRGLAAKSTTSSTPSAAGSTQDGRTSTSRSGTAICSPMATAVVTVTGHRNSPCVRRCHAGTARAACTAVSAWACSHSPAVCTPSASSRPATRR